MNKKLITGAVIALTAGIAAFIYNRKRNRINEAAANVYNELDQTINGTERTIENAFS